MQSLHNSPDLLGLQDDEKTTIHLRKTRERRSPRPERPRTDLPWRLLFFTILAAVVLVGAQLLEVWLFPARSVDFGLAQFAVSDDAATSLRLHEALHALLPVARTGLVILVAILVFVPSFRGRRA